MTVGSPTLITPSDPASNELCNSFDLIRIHKFWTLDEDTSYDVKMTKRPSYNSMMEWAREQEDVKLELVKVNLDVDASSFDDEAFRDEGEDGGESSQDEDGGDADKSWMAKLQMTETGFIKIKTTFFNVERIISNDPETKRLMRYNEHSDSLERWNDGEDWKDVDSLKVRKYIGGKYGADFPKQKADEAIEKRGDRNKYHPVRDYLDGLPDWDGVARVDTLFIDYFGCDDNVYSRDVARCWMVAGVKRIYRPGCKFDFVPVISGAQGIGKTSFLMVLGGAWYGELTTFEPKPAIEEISSKWIVEINEMGAVSKPALEQQKAFLSGCQTRTRLSYRRNALNYKRQCIFMATTNMDEYLKDSTGNRRWWPLEATVDMVDLDRLRRERDQLWAEAVAMWAVGTPIFLSGEGLRIAEDEQEDKRESDPWDGIIEEYLFEEAYSDRYDDQSGGGSSGPLETRTKVCVLEVWEDCVGTVGGRPPKLSERKRIASILTNMRGWSKGATMRFGKRFGPQKVWKLDVQF